MRLRHGLGTEVRPQLLARLRTRLLLSVFLLLNESDEVELGELRLRDEARLLLGSNPELGHFPSGRLQSGFIIWCKLIYQQRVELIPASSQNQDSRHFFTC